MEQEIWFAIQSDVQGVVYDLELNENQLYLGGRFSFQSQNSSFNNFACLELSNSTQLGSWSSVIPTCNLDFKECSSQNIITMAMNPNVPVGNKTGSPIYIGGKMDTIQGNVMNGLARLVENSWVSFGSGVQGSRFSIVFNLALTSDFSTLYVGGSFSSANSVPVNDIVSWSISNAQFSALAPVEGWEGVVFVILPITSSLHNQDNPTNTTLDNEVSPISIGLITALTTIILCLLLIILAIIIAIVKFRPKSKKKRFPNPEDTSLTQSEKETWEGKNKRKETFYSIIILILTWIQI